MILIGSKSLKLIAPHLIQRKPSDFDFVCTQTECQSPMTEVIGLRLKSSWLQ